MTQDNDTSRQDALRECEAVKLLARDIHYAICDAGLAPQLPSENHELRETILRVIVSHGPALLSGGGDDTARLDYIERTFSAVTTQERYLPLQMIWGKGANGRTLREACDKYMKRDAAMPTTPEASK